jgi:hypothetical protein
MNNRTTIKNSGSYVHINYGPINQYFSGVHLTSTQPPRPPEKPRFWVELDRIQHVTVLLAALAMLTLTVLCCWPSKQPVPAITPLVVVLSLIGTVGFGYFYYSERALK